jgi:hypothetical protein
MTTSIKRTPGRVNEPAVALPDPDYDRTPVTLGQLIEEYDTAKEHQADQADELYAPTQLELDLDFTACPPCTVEDFDDSIPF